jgi:hypothetical protein
MNPKELEGRLTTVYERILTTVNNIEHIESTIVNGQAVVKIFLQPCASLETPTPKSQQSPKPSFANSLRALCLRSSLITAPPPHGRQPSKPWTATGRRPNFPKRPPSAKNPRDSGPV